MIGVDSVSKGIHERVYTESQTETESWGDGRVVGGGKKGRIQRSVLSRDGGDESQSDESETDESHFWMKLQVLNNLWLPNWLLTYIPRFEAKFESKIMRCFCFRCKDAPLKQWTILG